MFGAGIRGKQAIKAMKLIEINVLGIIDNGRSTSDKIDGVPILKPSQMLNCGNVKVLVTPKKQFEIIKEQLIRMEVKEKNIVDYNRFVSDIGKMIEKNI